MTETVEVMVNGNKLFVPYGATVAVAVVLAGAACRKSVTGEPRGPLCGMGVCFECRVSVDGMPHQRSCLAVCKPGMEVMTDE